MLAIRGGISMARKIVFLFLLLWLCCLCQSSFGQNPRRDVEILDFIDTTIRNHYYDPAYRGIDLDAHFKSIRERLKKSKSDQESMVILAAKSERQTLRTARNLSRLLAIYRHFG